VDRALVERARGGDRDAYEALAHASARRLYLTAYRIVRDGDQAEDAVQHTLVAMWRELPSLRDQLERALHALSVEHRTIVVLHHYVGLPLGEIAEILGVPYGTVGSRLHHAMRALRASVSAGERTAISGGQPA
jgi:DNA-directed RNA polymerase specialized sigma24 family protein